MWCRSSLPAPGYEAEHCRLHAAVCVVLLAQCDPLLLGRIPHRQGVWDQVGGLPTAGPHPVWVERVFWYAQLHETETCVQLLLLFLSPLGRCWLWLSSFQTRNHHLFAFCLCGTGRFNTGVEEYRVYIFSGLYWRNGYVKLFLCIITPFTFLQVIFAAGAFVNRFWLMEVGRFVFGWEDSFVILLKLIQVNTII